MIRSLDDLYHHVVTENPEIIYLTEWEFMHVSNDPAVLVHLVARPNASLGRFMGRPILLKPPSNA